MNNPGYFESLWSVIWTWIKNSLIYKILCKIYGGISGSWQRSMITSWLRRETFSADAFKNSIIGKILCFPFTILEFLQKKIGAPLGKLIENSLFINLCKGYLHNLLALNLRFIGFTLMGLGVGIMASGNLSLIWAGLVVIGVILAFFDLNATDWLSGSGLIRLVCHLFNLEPDFNWYNHSLTEGKGRCVLGAVSGLLLGAVGGLIHPLIGILAVFGIAVLFLIMERPIAGVYFLVLLAPLAPTMALAGLSMLIIFSLVIKSIIDANFKWRITGTGFLLLAFLFVYLIGAINSFSMIKSLSIWAIYAAFIFSFFMIINLIRDRKQLKHLLVTFVFSGLLVCLYGIAQYVFGWDTQQAWMDEEMFSDIKMRIYSTLENPNVLGEYILLVLPAAIGLMWTSKKMWQKITYAGISGIMLVALIMTFSRGCWVGLMAAAAVFITFAAGKLWGLALIALPVIPAILPESIINRFTSIGDMKDSSTSYRVYIWMGTLAMIKDFWLCGIGMGEEAFKSVYPFYSYNGIVAPHSHNLFLQILVESGAVGIILFVGIMIFFFKRMMTGYQAGGGKGKVLPTMMTALAAGVCGFLVQGMFDNCFYNYRVMLIFWQVIAMAVAAVYVAKSEKGDKI